jgi:hypothetical protein
LLLNGADGITQHKDTLSLIITILYIFAAGGGGFIFLLAHQVKKKKTEDNSLLTHTYTRCTMPNI